jgi:hypothetical protein
MRKTREKKRGKKTRQEWRGEDALCGVVREHPSGQLLDSQQQPPVVRCAPAPEVEVDGQLEEAAAVFLRKLHRVELERVGVCVFTACQ